MTFAADTTIDETGYTFQQDSGKDGTLSYGTDEMFGEGTSGETDAGGFENPGQGSNLTDGEIENGLASEPADQTDGLSETDNGLNNSESDQDNKTDDTENEETISDGIFQYKIISDTEAAITGTILGDEEDLASNPDNDSDENNEGITEESSETVSEIVIPAEITVGENTYTVKAVEEDALNALTAETLYISESVTEFGPQILKNLKTIEVNEENPALYIKKGVLFRKNNTSEYDISVEDTSADIEPAEAKSTLILYPAASDAESYVVPENTAEIAEKAFAYSVNLKTIVFTEGLETLRANAVMSAQNSVEIAFAMEKMPSQIAASALYLDGADSNVVYFANEEAYETVSSIEQKFVDSPSMYDSDGVLLEDYSAAVAIVTDGIPEKIQEIIEAARKEVSLKDESVSEAAKKDELKAEKEDESAAEETLVGAGSESMDANISAGYYSFQSQAVNKFIKVKGASITESSITYLAAYSVDMGALFNIVPLGGGAYKIIAMCSNKALTLDAYPADNVAVVQKTYNGDKNQQWYIRKNDDGSCKILSAVNDSYALDTKNQATDSATQIILQKVSSNKTQSWKLASRSNPTTDKFENGIYKISSVLSSDKVLDIDAGSTASGANVQIYSSNGTEAQQFILRSLGYGNLYRIINVASNKSLDTKDRNTANNANVLQATQNSSYATQIWRIVKTSDGKYAVFNAGADRVLAIANGSAVNGANVRVENWSNANAQKWILTKDSGKNAVDVNGKDAAIKAGWYTMSSARTSRTIAVRNSSLANDANILIQSPGLGERSYFYVEPVGNEKYEIKAFCSNMVLTNVWGADSKDAGNVVQRTDSNLSTQRWYIRVSKKNNKYLSIVSVSDPNYVLSLKDNAAAYGTSVTTALSTGLNGQRWKLNAISSPNLSIPYSNTTYKIIPAANDKVVLSSEAQSKKSGANIQLMKKVNGGGEFWDFKKVGYGNLYKITNSYTGVALDAKNGGTSNGTNVWQYTANDSIAQLWRIMPVDAARTKFVIMNAASGKALDIYAGSMEVGTNIQLYTQNGTAAQEWTFYRANINTYIPVGTTVTLRQKGNTGRLLEVKNGSTENGARVQVYSERGNTDQMFVFVKKDTGIYKIRNAASNKYLDIKSTASGAGVISTANKDTDSQLWVIQSTGDGDASFYITNKKTGYALTSAYKCNTEAITRPYTKAYTQKFYFDTPLINTGWQQVGSGWRYYDKNGNAYRDTFLEDGKYYFDQNGYVLTGWKKYGSYYYYFKGKDGREYTDQRPYLAALFGSTGAKHNSQSRPNCPYYFVIDTARCVVTWYTRYPGTGDWNLPVVAFLCSPGTDSTQTDVGQRMTGYTREWIPLMGPSWGQFGTECKCYTYIAGTRILDWTNNGEYFHSIACGSANTYNLNPNTYNLLGTRQSHGCIRLGVRNAYWIYNFVDAGTKGRCGTNLAAPLRTLPQAWAITNIDPTDPHYTGNWGYVDSYATAYTNGAYIPRG